MHKGCSGTYKLIIKDRGKDRSVISMHKGCSGTYILIVEAEGGISQ